ncbi:Fic family protein [Treponema sp.]|uniref:Fic family protein n=1 Tax=Treponema sp. TaxID=166 RepID=UPI00298ECE0A|nr:Fic family protein [Treponema sp.]MCR5612840.1 Fic family protein [Treponema sp.]
MYIYEYREWPNFTYDSKNISILLEDCHVAQGKLLSKMELLGLSQKEDKILENISSDVIKSSEIEGFLLNKDQVRSSIARRLGFQKQPLVNTERNVDAVVEMMLDATQNYEKPLTKERLFSWHACLFPTGYSGMNKIEVAQYRSGAMQVVSGAIGMERIHYEAPCAEKISEEMEIFFNWLNDDKKKDDSLVNAAIAHLWFVTIHPFEDGNGRIARTISDMMLCRSDHTNLRFYSMSNQISKDKNNYYDVLERTQHSSPDITEWLSWFLNCLQKAIDESYSETEKVLKKYSFLQNLSGLQLNARQRLMLERLTDGNWFGVLNSSKWAKIAKCSGDTALRDITDLIQKGILEKEQTSGGRSTNYRLKEN